MAQYKHDRFFKFYIQSLYRLKGNTIKNIQIHNDEDLEIDLMFIGDLAKQGWKEQDLGLFDRLALLLFWGNRYLNSNGVCHQNPFTPYPFPFSPFQ